MSYDSEAPLSEGWAVVAPDGNPDNTQVVTTADADAMPANVVARIAPAPSA